MSGTTNKFFPDVREQAVQLVLGNEAQHPSRSQSVMLIAAKIACTPQTLNDWVNKVEVKVDGGRRTGISNEMANRMNALERGNKVLRQANEILRKAASSITPLGLMA
jgi:transposase